MLGQEPPRRLFCQGRGRGPLVRRAALLLATLAGTAWVGAASAGAQVSGHYAAKTAAESTASVYFGRDSAALDATDAAVIARQAESLRGDAALIVTLRGYADDMSSAAYGLAFGQKRLEAVRTALLAAGILPRRIRVEIHAGDLAAEAACTDDADCQQWRRVDMFLGN